jgi:hypothetical protein
LNALAPDLLVNDSPAAIRESDPRRSQAPIRASHIEAAILNAVADGTRPEASSRIIQALACLAGAYVLVLVVVTLANANGHWFGTPATVTVGGARFEVVRGRGHPESNALVLESLDPSGAAIVSSRVAGFAAAAYPRVEWAMKSAAFNPPALMFLWRTLENPNRTHSKPIEWDGHVGRVLPLRLAETNGWSGTIVGVALAVRGPLTSPLTIDTVTLPGVSSLTSVREILGQWTRSFPFHGGSIAFPFDKERNDHLSFLLATVAAQGLAIAACAILARRRRDRVDSRVIWTILIAGWLVLDARWQINLGRQLVQTAEAFAGKVPGPINAVVDVVRIQKESAPDTQVEYVRKQEDSRRRRRQ